MGCSHGWQQRKNIWSLGLQIVGKLSDCRSIVCTSFAHLLSAPTGIFLGTLEFYGEFYEIEFLTQFKITFLLLFTGCRKVLWKMPVQDTNFFKNNDLHAYQKNENTDQAILPLIENMNEVMTSGKYGIVIMVDLGPFDSVLRDGAIYKLYKAGITNKLLLPVLASFLKHRQYRNLVNTHTGNWSNKISGVPQGLILCPLIFLVCTADMSVVDETRKEHELNASEYADDFNIWRTHKNCFTLLANIQLLAFINL